MSVQNAGIAIREARLKAGLTQEQLSEGVCSCLSLSRIENGTAGVSPSTFQALMAHAGADCEAYPVFANRTDFDCFYTLKKTRFYLDSWQLQLAYDELTKLEDLNWAQNKYYYQEWLFLSCKLQFRSGCGDHSQLYDLLSSAIQISRPNFNSLDLRSLLLSINEIEICILLAQEALYLRKLDVCLDLCTQLSAYLSASQITYLEKDRLFAEQAIVYSKYLLAIGDYTAALKTADVARHNMVVNIDDPPLHELTFLTSLGYYYIDNEEQALTYFKTAFLSAHSIRSCYATTCRNYVQTHLNLELPDRLQDFPDIPLTYFSQKNIIDTSSLGDGTYDIFSPDVLTLGGLIRELRMEQKLSQAILCQGLCSKSKLSKIENDTLQPTIILAQTLLQRLGISDLVFTFYGSKSESFLQDNIIALKKTRKDNIVQKQLIENNLSITCTVNDILYKQYLAFSKANRELNMDMRVQGLKSALYMTLPHFEYKFIQKYRLSWMELTILNNLCVATFDVNPSLGLQYFYKLWEYFECTTIDILESKRIFPVTLGMFVTRLYTQKRYAELNEFSNLFSVPEVKSSLYFTGHIYFHYCQSLGEQKAFSQSSRYGHYAYYNYSIQEVPSGMELLKAYLLEDFHIELL